MDFPSSLSPPTRMTFRKRCAICVGRNSILRHAVHCRASTWLEGGLWDCSRGRISVFHSGFLFRRQSLIRQSASRWDRWTKLDDHNFRASYGSFTVNSFTAEAVFKRFGSVSTQLMRNRRTGLKPELQYTHSLQTWPQTLEVQGRQKERRWGGKCTRIINFQAFPTLSGATS